MSDAARDIMLPPDAPANPCLPLAISVVSGYWDVAIPVSEAEEIAAKYPDNAGDVLVEGLDLARRHGLSCIAAQLTLDDIKAAIDGGIPPIVLLPGIQGLLVHASVISGYDPADSTIQHYIPQGDFEGDRRVGVIPERIFSAQWEQDGRIAILIGPKESISRIPADAANADSVMLCLASERETMLGRRQKAVEILEEAVSRDQENEFAHFLLGNALAASGTDGCLAHYDRCIKLNPKTFLARMSMGNYHMGRKEYSRAESVYTDAISINPSRSGSMYKNRGIARIEQGSIAEGKDDLKEYLRLVPKALDRGKVERFLKAS